MSKFVRNYLEVTINSIPVKTNLTEVKSSEEELIRQQLKGGAWSGTIKKKWWIVPLYYRNKINLK